MTKSETFQLTCDDDCGRFEEQISGSYRDLGSYLVVLAKLYILIDKALGKDSFFLHFVDMPDYHFHIAIGADGAPFGKDDEATAWLVSFLNVGKHVQSQTDTFSFVEQIVPSAISACKDMQENLFLILQILRSRSTTLSDTMSNIL